MRRPCIVIVGAGFAGFAAARTLSRLARGAAEIVVVNPTDYFLYLPLLPEVAGGILDPRRVAVSLTATLPGIRLVLGAGSTGSEVAAHGQLSTAAAARRLRGLDGRRPHWLLLDLAPRVLPELDPRLSATAHRVLGDRGVDIRTRTSVQEARADGVRL